MKNKLTKFIIFIHSQKIYILSQTFKRICFEYLLLLLGDYLFVIIIIIIIIVSLKSLKKWCLDFNHVSALHYEHLEQVCLTTRTKQKSAFVEQINAP